MIYLIHIFRLHEILQHDNKKKKSTTHAFLFYKKDPRNKSEPEKHVKYVDISILKLLELIDPIKKYYFELLALNLSVRAHADISFIDDINVIDKLSIDSHRQLMVYDTFKTLTSD